MQGQERMIVLAILVSSAFNVECKNIVFLPMQETSHVRTHGLVAQEMVKMGHNTWLAMSSAFEKRKADIYTGVNTFSYSDFWEHSEDDILTDIAASINQAVESGTGEPDWEWIVRYADRLSEVFFQAMKNGKLIEYIENLKPDLIVLDWYPDVDEKVAIAYKLNVPFAIVSALHSHVVGRIPFNPVAEAYNSQHFSDASLFEQVLTVGNLILPLFQHIFNDRGYLKQLIPTGDNVPAANELINKAEVFIVESDPVMDYPRPMLPNVKMVGGISAGPAKALQEPFKSFIEKSEKDGVGVAVFSFGSLFLNYPANLEAKLVRILKLLKLNIIWRANITSPDPSKILTSSWIPQNDLLGNKNVKVFMTHSGINSLYEGIYHGVPMVCLPLYYDQQANMERFTDKNYGRGIDVLKATEDEIVKVIEYVVSSKEIKESIGKASDIYRELYKNPKHEAAYWLDHVLRHGGSYMRYSGQKIPMYLFVMDYVLVFVAGILVTISFMLLVFISRIIFCFCFRKKKHLKYD